MKASALLGRASVCISGSSSPIWAEGPSFGVVDAKAPSLLLKLNAILNLGISAERDRQVRSARACRSWASESLLRSRVVKEGRGAGRGHCGNGKE